MEFELRTDKSNGRRAVNKPLTILWMLGLYREKGTTTFTFTEMEEALTDVVRQYTSRVNVRDPYWRLRNDGILVFDNEDEIKKDSSSGATVTSLRKYGTARFSDDFLTYISEPDHLALYCEEILDEFFTDAISDDVLLDVGLHYREDSSSSEIQEYRTVRRKRDPQFRKDVAIAYNHQCAICRFSVLVGSQSLGNEAAHIRWHSRSGPDHVTNGLNLCPLHHKLFDRGIIGLDNEYRMLVSDRASSASEGFRKWVYDFEGKLIDLPRKEVQHPDPKYVDWHRDEVFISCDCPSP